MQVYIDQVESTKIDLVHDLVIQKTTLLCARGIVITAAIGIVFYAVTLVLRIIAGLCVAIVDLVHAAGALISALVAPLQCAGPAVHLIIIVAVLIVAYKALQYIASGKKGHAS
jgi:hypothetical protein